MWKISCVWGQWTRRTTARTRSHPCTRPSRACEGVCNAMLCSLRRVTCDMRHVTWTGKGCAGVWRATSSPDICRYRYSTALQVLHFVLCWPGPKGRQFSQGLSSMHMPFTLTFWKLKLFLRHVKYCYALPVQDSTLQYNAMDWCTCSGVHHLGFLYISGIHPGS